MNEHIDSSPRQHTAERSSGFRRIFSLAPIYRIAQLAIGAAKSRKILVADILRVTGSDKILDIGCGTADILEDIPESVDYIGFDPSDAYITDARSRFGHRGEFITAGTTDTGLLAASDRTLVMAIGVFHHLNDDGVRSALELAKAALVDGGRFVSIDPTIVDGQHPIGRFLAKRDRGEFVRTPDEIAQLVHAEFPDAKISVRHDMLRVPYSHVLVAT